MATIRPSHDAGKRGIQPATPLGPVPPRPTPPLVDCPECQAEGGRSVETESGPEWVPCGTCMGMRRFSPGDPEMLIFEAYGRYHSDPRVHGPDGYQAFRDAVRTLLIRERH